MARHDTKAEVVHVASNGAPTANVIVREALERNADLLAIGAYSHPRAAELLFSGTTRSLLASAPVPMIISR
ncbi:universal stress protein [Consotaella aegiceratis]|uniref:universal stress protein n=1 Tax=Consotaella aegiceratis TaxID=3097961 RepID=UPI003D809E5C